MTAGIGIALGYIKRGCDIPICSVNRCLMRSLLSMASSLCASFPLTNLLGNSWERISSTTEAKNQQFSWGRVYEVEISMKADRRTCNVCSVTSLYEVNRSSALDLLSSCPTNIFIDLALSLGLNLDSAVRGDISFSLRSGNRSSRNQSGRPVGSSASTSKYSCLSLPVAFILITRMILEEAESELLTRWRQSSSRVSVNSPLTWAREITMDAK
jgi:hypothetical protein